MIAHVQADAGFPVDAVLDTAALVLILIGALLCLTAAIGLLRFHDVPTRLHAATKPQVLGIILLMIGVGLRIGSWAVVGLLLLVVILQFLTAPVSAHLVVRAAHRRPDHSETPDQEVAEDGTVVRKR